MTARDRLHAFVIAETDEDAAEYDQRLNDYRAEVLREAAEKLAAECAGPGWHHPCNCRAAERLRRMADQAGTPAHAGAEPDPAADFFQPGRTYAYGQTGYRAPELTTLFRVEHVTRHPERGRLRAIGWARTGEPSSLWRGHFQDEGEFEGWAEVTSGEPAPAEKPAQAVDMTPVPLRWDRLVIHPCASSTGDTVVCCNRLDDGHPAALFLNDEHREALGGMLLDPDGDGETAELTVYRASHESIVMGLYTTPTEARAHCVAEERRTWAQGAAPVFDWIEDEEDGVAELVTVDEDGETETVTGYVVTPLTVASAYDEDGDE